MNSTNEILKYAITAHRDGKLSEAITGYQKVLESEPSHPDANHNLGVIRTGLGEFEIALALFRRALGARPDLNQFWLSLILCLIESGQTEEAKRTLESALAPASAASIALR